MYKKITDHQGGFLRDIFMSRYIDLWLNKVAKFIDGFLLENHFEVIQRVTPDSYRKIPDLRNIRQCIKVLGPVGGAQETPDSLLCLAYGKNGFVERIHRLVNWLVLSSCRYRKRLNQFDYILSSNEETLLKLKKISPCKRHLIMTDVGIDSNTVISKKVNGVHIFTFIWVGRYLFRKGLDLILESAFLIKDKKFKIIFVGDGPERKRIVAKANKLGLSSIIEFAFKVPLNQTSDFYAKSDCFLFPSFRESGGTVLAEALANQLPAIALDIGGAHTICSNKDSYLVSTKGSKQNIVEAFSKNMLLAMNDPLFEEKKMECKNRARELLSWDKKEKILEGIYSNEI